MTDKTMQEQSLSAEVCVPCLRSGKCQGHMANLPWFLPCPSLICPAGILASLLALHHGQTQLIWICLGTDRQHRANVTCVPTPSVIEFGFSSFFFFFLGQLCCWHFVLHAPCCLWGVSFTHPMLLYVSSFSYTPHSV